MPVYYPLQHASMTSCPKWEELARFSLSSSSVVSAEAFTYVLVYKARKIRFYSEGRTEAGYSYCLCSLGEMFFFYMAANGICEEYLFPNASIYVRQEA